MSMLAAAGGTAVGNEATKPGQKKAGKAKFLGLPTIAWAGLGVVGAYLLYRKYKGSSTASATPTTTVPAAAPSSGSGTGGGGSGSGGSGGGGWSRRHHGSQPPTPTPTPPVIGNLYPSPNTAPQTLSIQPGGPMIPYTAPSPQRAHPALASIAG